MKSVSSSALLSTMLWLGILTSVWAQEPTIVTVSQVLPFAVSGSVTSGGAVVPTGETSISASSANAQAAVAPMSIATAGGKVSTGSDGVASLVLGAGAEVGTARLGLDSEVKVPDAGEKGHSLEMLKGQLFLNISADELKHRGNSAFKLKTPAALLAVKGTKFFSSTQNGTDTIGVHEGSVEVVEPTTGEKVTLAAGQAVDVSPGVLSARREMTAEELETSKTYVLAELKSMPLAVFLGDFNDSRLTHVWFEGKQQDPTKSWVNWRRVNSSIWFLNRPDNNKYTANLKTTLTDLGAVQSNRGSLSIRLAVRGGIPQKDNLGIPLLPLVPPAKLQALQFRLRALNCEMIEFHGVGGVQINRFRQVRQVSVNSTNGSWQDCQIPLVVLKPPAKQSAVDELRDDEYRLSVNFLAKKNVTKSSDHVPAVVEMKDFRVLMLP